jgi:formate-dependent nitrite reductase membrane component NrfD
MGDDRRDVPFDAPWANNMRHRPDPNRVTVAPSQELPVAPSALAPPQVMPSSGDHSYYDVPMLKRPLWKWEIAWYFFLGGVSSGAYVLSRLAERHGGEDERYRDVTRIGTYLALASFLPCPPLLIHDLGDPKRFHHMLRMFKPSTPMNFGTWSIVGYSGMAAAAALREYMKDNVWRDGEPPTRLLRMADKALLLVHDAAGIPFAILVAGYTGVLLSCTANPLWCKNPWLGPLFSASAVATGAQAIGLALDCTRRGQTSSSHEALRTIDTIAHVVGGACMRGFMNSAGEAAKPLRTGGQAKNHKLTIGAMLAAEALKLLPTTRQRGPRGRGLRMLSNLLGLAGGFALRWSIVHGGREAADDPHLSRLVSDPNYQQKQDRSRLGTSVGTRSARGGQPRAPQEEFIPTRGAHASSVIPR